MRYFLLTLCLISSLVVTAQSRNLLKLGVAPAKMQPFLLSGPSVGFERLLGDHFSLVAQAEANFDLIGRSNLDWDGNSKSPFYGVGVGIGPRYYFQKQEVTSENPARRLCSGFYTSLITTLDVNRKAISIEGNALTPVTEPSLLLYVGHQGRPARHLLLNACFGLGARSYSDRLNNEFSRRSDFTFDVAFRIYYVP